MLTFHNIAILHIHFVQISSCGSSTVPAVSVVSVSRVETFGSVFQDNGKASLLVVGSMLNCSRTNFSSTFGIGLMLCYNSHVEVYDSVFSNNSGGGINSTNSTLTLVGTNAFMNNAADCGGGISAIESSINITGNTTFLSNSARTSGGGVYIKRSTLSCNGTILFTGNIISGRDVSTGVTATGGGISALDSRISLEGNSTFANNVAMDGGGLYLKRSQLDSSGYISFVHNHADGDGGGLLLSNGTGNVGGISNFISNTANYGGGVGIVNNSDLKLSKNTLFEKNVANQSAGGIYIYNSWLHCNVYTRFVSNMAIIAGSALKSVKSTVELEGESWFMKNTAKFGGGISAVNGSYLTLSGNITFAGNQAYQGGGIIVEDSLLRSRGNVSFTNNLADDLGGGILSIYSNVKLKESISFVKSTAYYAGGALYSHNSDVSVEGDGRFINNSAEWLGGGIAIGSGGNLTLNGNYMFAENVAYQGGGIYVQNGSLSIRGHISFIHNLANDSGGGLISGICTVKMEGDGIFINNSAEHGGGIANLGSGGNLTLNGNYMFAENVAYQGGGMYVHDGSLSIRGHISFIHNLANSSGGGLISGSSTLKMEGDGIFINNLAEHGGGISIVYGGYLTLNGNYMFAENLAVRGGGIFVHDSSMSVRGHTSFINNVANETGGGFISDNSSVRVEGDARFINNSALFGGGISVVDGGGLTLRGNKIVFASNWANQGGALYSEYSNVSVEVDGRFINNSAELGGGFYIYRGEVTLNGDNTFARNWALEGAGFTLHSSNLSSRGNISFTNNLAYDRGGGFVTFNSSVKLQGGYTFVNNTAIYAGGALYSEYSAVSVEVYCRFINNTAQFGGGFSILDASEVTLNGNITFAENFAKLQGGGIDVRDSYLSSRGCISFTNNVAFIFGGGFASVNSSIELEKSTLNQSSTGDGEHNGHVLFENNFAGWGGGLWTTDGTNMSTTVLSVFRNNTAVYGGGGGVALYTGCTVTLSGMSTFTQNTARYGGGVLVVDSTMKFMARTFIHDNSAIYGGGIHGSRAIHEISDTVSFTENSATNGGGVSLAKSSQCLLSPNSTVYLRGNHAEQYGGAIFVADEPFLYCKQFFLIKSGELCFFQPLDLPHTTVHFILENNSAEEGGTDLYGGMVNKCDLRKSGFHSGIVFNTVFNNTKDKHGNISSAPFRVCPCYDGHQNCSQSKVTVTVYPGETFSVSLVAVGQRDRIVPSLIRSTIDGNGASLGELQRAQSANNTCTPLHYTVSSINHSVIMTLLADGPCLDLGDSLQVNVDLKSCPVGFQLSEASKRCICEQRLQKYTNSCDIDDLTIGVDGNTWVGLDKTADGIITHPHCPFDYCKSHSVRFTLNETDLQCNYDRTGLLCGGCQPGCSLALGSSHCLQCSNAYLSLLAAFALAGIALVILLLVCKLTVAIGTINGLIFYANIIAVNQSVFFPSGDTNAVLDILRVFIAWLNLDLGIETCFYDGLDAFTRTWLQFIFPAYIWVLVCSVIILCYYKTWAVRMFGRNPVAVLATLFLLSYAKLLHTIITALSFTFLEYSDGPDVAVWLYDGNLRYLQGKHIPLFMVAMTVLLLLFLPYTVVLSLGQWIQARSRNRLFSWISDYRVKAFLDAYHGPFKPKHRYWHGLLLVYDLASS